MRKKIQGLTGKMWVAKQEKKVKRDQKAWGHRGNEKSERGGDTGLLASNVSPAGVAATTPSFFTCTDQAAREAAQESHDSLGLGQARTEEKREMVDPSFGSLGELYTWLDSRVDDFLARHCKTSTTGRLFPLPSSPYVFSQVFPKHPQKVLRTLKCLVCALNSLNGEGVEGPSTASDYQVVVLKGLMEDCERVVNWGTGEPPRSWKEFFRVKGVDYKGEEVLTAQVMRWVNVAPALPKEVGSVPLEDVVEWGCRHYVLNFSEYLLDPSDQVAVKPPRVLVPPEDWENFCSNLLDLGVCSKVHESDLYEVGGRPLLNGLFGVSKNEFEGGTEVMRIIMNLIPLNGVCRGFEGDVSTLPSWAGMSPLHLQPHEHLLVSSEDVRAFFYIFKVPREWHRFLAFNRPLPKALCGPDAGNWYPCSAVLPMGFKNSVALAQHVHRYIVQQALKSVPQGGEAELRKDRPFTNANPVHRIYLDNFDELERVSTDLAHTIAGQLSPLTESLQETYAVLGVPRHPKKGVARQSLAEVQGAIIDGEQGLAHPKIEKIVKYAQLARLLLVEGFSTQKQMQVVRGGFVYIAMFRRPLLGALNHVWKFIVECEGYPPVVKFALPAEVKQEIARFLGLIPLAYMNFRCQISDMVTASDASEKGGGVTASQGLTPMGIIASKCQIRGDIVEPSDIPAVLTIGLFDGIGALRVAADALGWNVLGHSSIEKSPRGSPSCRE